MAFLGDRLVEFGGGGLRGRLGGRFGGGGFLERVREREVFSESFGLFEDGFGERRLIRRLVPFVLRQNRRISALEDGFDELEFVTSELEAVTIAQQREIRNLNTRVSALEYEERPIPIPLPRPCPPRCRPVPRPRQRRGEFVEEIIVEEGGRFGGQYLNADRSTLADVQAVGDGGAFRRR